MLDILFITPNHKPRLREEVNGTLLLGTRLLEAGFSVDVLRFWQIEQYRKDYGLFIEGLVERILELRPKCVSFYCLWPQYHTVIRTAELLKQRCEEVTVILGGPQASATAAETLEAIPWVDYVCAGEGEETAVPFFTALLRNGGRGLETVPGLYRREDGRVIGNEQDVPLRELDTLPRWDERLYLPHLPQEDRTGKYYWMSLDVGRGCPFSCTFCASSKFWRRTYRMKSPKRIVDDMQYFNEKFGIRSFSFNHDAFTVNKKLTAEVCDEILARGLDVTWKCTTRVDCIDKDLILKMKQAGLAQIELGVETGSERIQKLVRKNLDLARVRELVDFLIKQKLRVALLFMYGFPEETEEDLVQTLELLYDVIDAGAHYISLSFCSFNPKTDMTVKHFDDLVLDPDIKVLERTVYGHEEGQELFRKHKELFPFRYHLHTPVRDQYQYMQCLVMMYFYLPKTGRYLRELYGRDDLRMYRDFYDHNRPLMDQGFDKIMEVVMQNPLPLTENMLKDFDPVLVRHLLEMMRFEIHLWQIRHGTEDLEIRQVYGFHYMDFAQKRPLDRFLPGSTEILLRRKDRKPDLQVLRFLM